MRIEAVVARVSGIDAAEVADWLARGWVEAGGTPPDWIFDEVQLARVRLVRDLRHDAGVEEDALALVLSLLDQVYTLRRGMRVLREALEDQPAAVRDAVLARLRG